MNDKKYDLASIQKETNAMDVFKTGCIEKIIQSVEDEVRKIVPDTSTNKGRDAITFIAKRLIPNVTISY